MSGPAGGVTGAVWVAEQCGHRDLITFDMGGTSTDVGLVQDLSPRIGRETKVGDLTVRASSVDVRTVGAGGGSIAHVPELTKALRVGPQSAGADPGPAAYGKGGTEPTVTDANVVLGYLPTSLAGGEITLDVEAARAAVGKIADAHGAGVPGGRRGRDRRHRQREHARRAAAGLGAAGLRPARLRAGRVRRRRPAARQRARRADRRMAGDRAAVPGRALRPRRRHHQPPRRVGPHRAAPVRPARGRRAGPDAARARRRGRAAAGRAGPAARPADGRLPGRRPLPRPGLRDPGRRRRPRHRPGRPSASASTPSTTGCSPSCSTSTTRWSTPAPRSPGRSRTSRRCTWRPATATRPARACRSTRSTSGASTCRAGVYDRAKLRAGDVVRGPAIVTEMDSTTLVLPGHAATVHAVGLPADQPLEG